MRKKLIAAEDLAMNTTPSRIAHSIPLGVPITLITQCRGQRGEHNVTVVEKEFHSKYSIRLGCLGKGNTFGYFWVWPEYRDTYNVVTGFRYA